MPKISNIIEVKNLTYKNILQNINLVIPKGKYIAISGTNSAGKTTLIKLLSTTLTIKDCIFFKQKKIDEINKKTIFQEIGLIFPEEKQKFINATVEEEIFYILENTNMEQKKKIEKYQKIIKMINIENILTKNPNELTHINYIKLLLATALISTPSILLTDNICSNLTKKERKELLEILKLLNKEEKLTIIMATNNLEEVLEANYLYILNKGKIAMEGTPLEVLKQDNKLNKLGLELPLMVDLSVKLHDYDLLKDIIIDMDRMVDTLWK